MSILVTISSIFSPDDRCYFGGCRYKIEAPYVTIVGTTAYSNRRNAKRAAKNIVYSMLGSDPRAATFVNEDRSNFDYLI